MTPEQDFLLALAIIGGACTVVLTIILLPGIIYHYTWRPWKLFFSRFHKKVIGYKGFRPGLICDLGPAPYQYEVGKTYVEEGDPSTCGNGFHFCKKLRHVFSYYPRERGCIYCEVEALGKVDTDPYGKSCTDVIRIVRQLSEHDIRLILNDQRKIEQNAKKKRRKKRRKKRKHH